MKKILTLFLFLAISFGLVGCTSSNNANNDVDKKTTIDSSLETGVKEDNKETMTYNVDWEKCINDTKAEFINSDYYTYVKDVYIEVSNDEITFTAVVSDSTDSEVVLDFADSIIRRFNSNAQLQNSSIKSSGKDYLGGLYDTYKISIGISALSTINNSNEWYICDVIGKGVHKAPKLQN